MPAQHVRSMLDSIQDNGGTDDIKALGAGVREALKILDKQSKRSDEQDRLALVTLKSIEAHIKNDKCHTPKGLLVRSKVIAWCVFIVILISTIVMYIPEGVSLIKSLP